MDLIVFIGHPWKAVNSLWSTCVYSKGSVNHHSSRKSRFFTHHHCIRDRGRTWKTRSRSVFGSSASGWIKCKLDYAWPAQIFNQYQPRRYQTSWTICLQNYSDAKSRWSRRPFYFINAYKKNFQTINGSHRCSLSGVDLNRVWDRPSPILHPPIFHSKGLIQYLVDIQHIKPFVFVDLHGHSRRPNVFMFGNNPEESWRNADHSIHHNNQYMVLPEYLSQIACGFSLKECRFNIAKSKESSARVTLWRQFNIERSYTMESTYCGFDTGRYAGKQVSKVLVISNHNKKYFRLEFPNIQKWDVDWLRHYSISGITMKESAIYHLQLPMPWLKCPRLPSHQCLQIEHPRLQIVANLLGTRQLHQHLEWISDAQIQWNQLPALLQLHHPQNDLINLDIFNLWVMCRSVVHYLFFDISCTYLWKTFVFMPNLM